MASSFFGAKPRPSSAGAASGGAAASSSSSSAAGGAASSSAASSAAGKHIDEDDDIVVPVALPPTSRALPWVEKYRPKSMTDISSQEEIVRSLTNAIKVGTIPHLLFYGPPGTGKTSTILAVARDLFG